METNEPRSTNGTEPSAPIAAADGRVLKKRRGFWRRMGLVLLWLLLIVLVLGFGTGLFVQLPVFRRMVVNELASVIENGTNGKLSIGDIQGNLFEGFVMSNVTLRLKTGTAYDSIPLLHADRIIAQYSLLHWLRTREIKISNVVLQHPVVHFVKFAGDTNWNYDLFAKGSSQKTPNTPFSQIVDLARLQIQNGSFFVRDYNYPEHQKVTAATYMDTIDWNDVEVQGIDLESQFYIHGALSDSARVSHLQFRETKSGLFVQRLGFSGYMDSSRARIEHAKIITGHSDLEFSIEVAPPRIIETGLFTSLQHSSVKANITGPVISTNELKQFLPRPLGFLGGSPGIDLVTIGEFGKLHIKKLALDFKNRGSITISGDLNNLHQPDSLTMDLDLHAKDLSNATLDDYVPGLHLPDLKRFGNINITDLTYKGAPLNFHTTFDATSSDAGNASGDVSLDLRKKQIEYRAGVKTGNFNLAALVHDTTYESSITAETHIVGRGTNWRTMESTVTAKSDGSSRWNKYHIASLDLAGAMMSGTMTVGHLDAQVEGGPEVHVRSAMAEFISPTIPFRFDGSIKDFPLAMAIVSKPQNPAHADLDATISGTAKTFDDVNGNAHLRLFDLACQGHPLPDDTADITISATRSREDSLILHSTIADLTIDRYFKTGDLIHVIPDHINALLTAIEHRDFSPKEERVPIIGANADSIDFDYHLHVKDLRALADFFPETFMLGQGSISGTVSSANTDLNVSVNADSLTFIVRDRPSIDSTEALDTNTNKLAISKHDTSALALPKFGSGTPRIQLMPTTFRLTLQHLSNDSSTALSRLEGSLDFTTDSVIRLGSALLYHPLLTFNYKDRVLDFHANSLYNNALGISLMGNTQFPNGDLNFTVDSLKLVYKNPFFTPTTPGLREFVWKNDGQARIRLTKNGMLTVDTLNITHPLSNMEDRDDVGAQRMSVGGNLHGDSVNAWAKFQAFELEELRKILPINPNSNAFDFTKYTGKVRDFSFALAGTLEQPDLSTKLFADTIKYSGEAENEITFDSNYVNLSYHDQELRGILDLHVANVNASSPSLINANSLKGSELRASIDSIPMVLTFKRGPGYAADSARALSRPLSASIRAEQFPLDVATPFLPPFRQVVGTGDINFTATGTRQNIDYAGQATIQNGALLVAATNMWYLFGGQLAFAHNQLVLENDTIHNISSDDSLGSASLNGNFTFKGFDITNFDLHLRSPRLMVLSDAAKQTLPAAYGPLTINTGGQDFQFYNTFDAPWIKGTINVISANITMPQTDNPGQSFSSSDVIYETIHVDSVQSPAMQDTLPLRSDHAASAKAASVQISDVDDTLFPNSMKDIYRNDDGTFANALSHDNLDETPHENTLGPSFTDRLRMDLHINTEGTTRLTMPFGGAIGVLGSQLKAELKRGGSLNIERGNDLQSVATGEFELSQNSSFTYIDNFTISSGTVKFERDFSNPYLDVTADYIGPHHTSDNTTDQAKIELTITGYKNKPTITAINYEQPILGGEWETRQEQSPELAVEDAIYFLGTGGYFKNDVNGTNGGSAYAKMLPNLGEQVVGSVAANLAANILGSSGSTTSQFAIRSASLNFGSNAGAQITAAYQDITVKLGSANNGTGQYGLNTIIDIPVNNLISGDAYRNLIIELQGNLNPTNTPAGSLTQQPIFLTKFIYNIPLGK